MLKIRAQMRGNDSEGKDWNPRNWEANTSPAFQTENKIVPSINCAQTLAMRAPTVGNRYISNRVIGMLSFL